jgi:C_GCAxxG_C_C family probable redox protein
MLAVGEHVLGDLEPSLVRMTTGLSGGLGSTKQEMCGALSSGVLLIGALYGRSDLSEDDQLALELAARYRDRFLAEFRTTHCETLHDAVHSGSGLGSCSLVVERAARILLGVLADGGRIRR